MIGRGKTKKQAKLLTASALALACATSVPGQDAGGLNMSLSLSQQIEASDNSDFTVNGTSDVRSITNLRFNLSSVTRSQALTLNAGGRLELGDRDNAIDPFLRLSYGRQSRNASMSFSANYRESDVSDTVLTFLNADLEPELFVFDGGTRTDFDTTATLTFGDQSRFGGSISLTYGERDFNDTINPNLLDEERYSGDFRLRFEVSDTVTLGVFYAFSEEDEEGLGTDTDERRYGVSADVVFSDVLSGQFRLSFDEVETTIGTQPTSSSDGGGLSFSLTRTLKNGTLTGSFATDIETTGRQDLLQIRRAMELRSGALDWTVGYARTGSGDTHGIFGANYTYELPAARFRFGLNQNVSSSGALDRINTTLSMAYDQDLNEISSLITGLTVRDVNILAPNGNDSTRVDLNISYRRNVSRDWALEGGYRFSLLSSDASADVESNTLFIGLSRTFAWRP